jgi:hypothetical protein
MCTNKCVLPSACLPAASQWYFATLYAVFKPLVERRTRDKIRVLGADYAEALRQNIAPEDIPEEYGGSYTDVPWVRVCVSAWCLLVSLH